MRWRSSSPLLSLRPFRAKTKLCLKCSHRFLTGCNDSLVSPLTSWVYGTTFWQAGCSTSTLTNSFLGLMSNSLASWVARVQTKSQMWRTCRPSFIRRQLRVHWKWVYLTLASAIWKKVSSVGVTRVTPRATWTSAFLSSNSRPSNSKLILLTWTSKRSLIQLVRYSRYSTARCNWLVAKTLRLTRSLR